MLQAFTGLVPLVLGMALVEVPRPATAGIITGKKAKLVPCTIGNLAPTGPMPMV